MSYPVDSADARELAELAELADPATNEADKEPDRRDESARYRRIPMPPEISAEIRRTLADKRKRPSNEDK